MDIHHVTPSVGLDLLVGAALIEIRDPRLAMASQSNRRGKLKIFRPWGPHQNRRFYQRWRKLMVLSSKIGKTRKNIGFTIKKKLEKSMVLPSEIFG